MTYEKSIAECLAHGKDSVLAIICHYLYHLKMHTGDAIWRTHLRWVLFSMSSVDLLSALLLLLLFRATVEVIE